MLVCDCARSLWSLLLHSSVRKVVSKSIRMKQCVAVFREQIVKLAQSDFEPMEWSLVCGL